MLDVRSEDFSYRAAGRTAAAILVLASLTLVGCDDDDPVGPITAPDVAGLWIGQYNVTRCTLSNAVDPFFCDQVFYPGASLVFEMELDQSGAAVGGPAFLGEFSGQVEGRVDEVGLVELTGTIGAGEDARVDIQSFATLLEGDSLVGQWRFRIRDNTGSGFGSATVTADLLLVDPTVVPTFFNCPVEDVLARNDQLLGALTIRDCQAEDFTYFDAYALDVAAGDEILITMSSDLFEPFLAVADLDEALIAFDGEPGRTEAAVLILAEFPETWVIVANSFFADVTGDYFLSVERITGTTTTGVQLNRVTVRSPRERKRLSEIKRGGIEFGAAQASRASLRQRLMSPRDRSGGGR